MKAMILAAGLGTRLKPFTDIHPKALAIVNGKSLLQRNVEYLVKYGVTNIIINVHHFADQIVSAIEAGSGWGTKISISDETNEVLETGGGLKKAASFFETDDVPFILMNVDILTDLNLFEMMNFHKMENTLATLAVSERETSRYFLFNENMVLCGWENIKTGEQKLRRENTGLHKKAFSGLHIIDPKIFKLIKQEGKFSMVDVYLDLCNTNAIKGFDQGNCKFMDVGKPESILMAEKMFP
jgi:MurNAc alpha-1-phosphate uridylyltransferase